MESSVPAQLKGERPKQANGVKVLNPQNRVPVSLIIDDSTCLVNLATSASRSSTRYFPINSSRIGRNCPARSLIPSCASSASGVTSAE